MTTHSSKEDKNRRRVLKSITIGSGTIIGLSATPKRWMKPVISSIVLPAHAQTTTVPVTTPEPTQPPPTTATPVIYTLNCDFKSDVLDLGPVVNGEQTFILNITSSASATASDGSAINTSLDWAITYPGNFTLTTGMTNMVNGSASIAYSLTFNSFAELLAFPVDLSGSDATVTYRFSDPSIFGDSVGACAPFD